MQVISNENLICIDVDDTIVLECTEDHPDVHYLNYYKQVKLRRPHNEHISLMKSYKERGFTVLVWSGNGNVWAKEVIEKLGLEEYVDFIFTKPTRYIDDLLCESWMGHHIYMEPKD